MDLILIIAGIVGFVYLSGRIKSLEQQLSQLLDRSSRAASSASVSAEREDASEVEQQIQPSSEDFVRQPFFAQSTPNSVSYSPHSVPQEPNQFVEWMKEDLFMKLGALLLLIAFGWFVSYAFMNNWVGPMGRIVLGLLAGVSFMALGVWRINSFVHQGSVFVVLGSTTVLLTIFAAREVYDFFIPAVALGVMFLSVVFVAFVAVLHRHQNLALAGLILGGIAPLLTNSDPNVLGLFSYLLMLVAGSLWVVYKIGATTLPITAFLIVTLYGMPYLTGYTSGSDSSLALMFAFVFTIIFFVSNIVSILKRSDDQSRIAHLFLAAGTGLYLTAWISFAVDPVWRSLMDVAWAVAFAFGAFVVYLRTADRVPFYIYGAVALGLVAVATAAEFDGPVLTIAYTIEVTALVIAASQIFRDYDLLNKISSLFVGPMILSLGHIVASSWRDGFMHGDFFALAILMFCLWVSAAIVFEKRPLKEEGQSDAATGLGVFGAIYAVVLCWLITHSIFPDDFATGVSLFIYTVSGITLYVLGQSHDNTALRVLGGTLVGLVVGRLLLVDVWAMELAGRIITFFVIGILLISTAFITKMRKNHDTV